MSAPSIPISEASHQTLKALAEQTGQTMSDVLDKALDAYRRKLFYEQMNAGYAEMQADSRGRRQRGKNRAGPPIRSPRPRA